MSRSRGIAKYVISGTDVVTLADAPTEGVSMPSTAYGAIIIPEDQAIRWRDDGTNPDATTGLPLYAKAFLEFDGDLQKFRMCRDTSASGDATVWIAWRGV